MSKRTTLICRLHENQPQISWALFDNKQGYIDGGTQAMTELLPQPPTVILLPTIAFFLTQISIPSKQRQKIIQAVPYLLEEQLIDEVENLHFALSDRDPKTNAITVAVIAQQRLEQYLKSIQQLNFKAINCIPDVFIVPKPVEGWGILLLEEYVLVRTESSGFAIEFDCLPFILQSITQLPTQMTLFSSPDQLEQNQLLLTALYALGIPIIEESHPQGVFAWWQQGLASAKPINILQGLYRPVNQTEIAWRPWRLTGILLLIWSVVTFVNYVVNLQQLENQRQQLNTQLETVYRTAFPTAQRVVNPKAQMEQQLATLRSQKGQNSQKSDFLTLLTQLAPFLVQLPNLQLKRIDYLNEYFDITLTTTQLAALDQLKQSLQQIDLQLKIQTVTSHNNIVEAQLRISAFETD